MADTYVPIWKGETKVNKVLKDIGGNLYADGVYIVGGSSAGTEYTEDAAAAANPVGGVPILVRQDTPAVGTVTADGDNIAARANSLGAQYVAAMGDVVHGAADPSLSYPVKVGGKATASAPAAVDEGDRVAASFDLTGALRITGAAAGAAAGDVAHGAADSGNPVKVGGKATAAAPTAVDEGDRVQASFDLAGQQRVVLASVPSHAVTNGGTFAVQSVSAGDVAHDAADSGNPVKIGGKGTAAAPSAVTEGDRVQASFDLTGAMRTVVTTLPNLTVDSEITTKDMDTGGGTDAQAVVGMVVAASGGAVLIDPRGGDVAHDAADSGNPTKIGGKCRIATPTAVAEGDRVDAAYDPYGRAFTNIDPIVPLAAIHQIAAGDSAHTDVELIAAPAAGLSIYVYDIEITNDATAAITVQFEEATAGAKAAVGAKKYIPVSGGMTASYRVPLKLTAATNLGFTNTGQSNFGIEIHYKVAP